MGKKIRDLMDAMRVKFIAGCQKEKTLNEQQAESLWAQFEKFAEYAFNKSICPAS
jgi:DNA polymerase-3 subunit alpha